MDARRMQVVADSRSGRLTHKMSVIQPARSNVLQQRPDTGRQIPLPARSQVS